MNLKQHSLKEPNTDNPQFIVLDITHNNPYDYKEVHRHAYFEIILFRTANGEGKQIIDFAEYDIQEHDLFIVAPGQIHLMKKMPSDNGVILQFTKHFLTYSLMPHKLDWYTLFNSLARINLNEKQYKILNEYFIQIVNIQSKKSSFQTQKTQSLLSLIYFNILEIFETIKQSKEDNGINAFINHVENDFKQNRTVKYYSEKLNIPINKLNLICKERFGESPLQIINKILLDEIKRLLVINEVSHKEISYELNFDSQATFSRFIKQHTGNTPSELQKELLHIHKF